MADTLALSTGSFEVVSGNGSSKTLAVKTQTSEGTTTEVVTATNPGGNTGSLSGVSYTTTDATDPANIAVNSSTNQATTGSNYTLGSAGDTLVIASTKDIGNSSGSQFVATNSSFNLGDGNNTLTFSNAVRGVTVTSGAGTDTVTVQGDVQASSFNLGGGADKLIFGGDIKSGTTVNLGGNDGAVDTIQIAGGAKISGLSITGADNGDLLVIGTSSTYAYDSSTNNWVNTIDKKDKLNF